MPRQNTRKKIQSLISIDGLLERIGIRKKESVGIAFGGGGAKGFSHIGVLMALNEAGIYPDVISGVSAGSIAAVLYAAGLTPGEMRECFAEFNKINNYREWAVPKEGLFKLNKFGKLLDSWLPVKNLEELKIPTVVCATNIDKGDGARGKSCRECSPPAACLSYSSRSASTARTMSTAECCIIFPHGPSGIIVPLSGV